MNKLQSLKLPLFLICSIVFLYGTPQSVSAQEMSVTVERTIATIEAYKENLRYALKGNWDPPKQYQNQRGVIALQISPDGKLQKWELTQKTGNSTLDQSIKKSILQTFPFVALPPGYKEETYCVRYIFDYNLYVGGLVY